MIALCKNNVRIFNKIPIINLLINKEYSNKKDITFKQIDQYSSIKDDLLSNYIIQLLQIRKINIDKAFNLLIMKELFCQEVIFSLLRLWLHKIS